MTTLNKLYCLSDPAELGHRLSQEFGTEAGQLEWRQFPDGETYVRILDQCRGQHVAVFAQMDQADSKLMALVFVASQLRAMGAASVGLIVPYLPYMRHDIRFRSGEALSSQIVSGWLQTHFQWLLTVDPHLHRYDSLSELYSIPHYTLSASATIANWIQEQDFKACLVGPDAESMQWVQPIAELIDAPYIVLNKDRKGDRNVQVDFATGTSAQDHTQLLERLRSGVLTPILVDDILSTGMTIKQAAAHLASLGLPKPLCIVVHALFSDHQEQSPVDSGMAATAARTLDGTVAAVVSTNSIWHETNAIDLVSCLNLGLRQAGFEPEAS